MAVEKVPGKPKPSGAVESATRAVTSRLANRAAAKHDLSTETGAKKAENAQTASDVASAAAGGAVAGAKAGPVGAVAGAAAGAIKGFAKSPGGRKKIAAIAGVVAAMLLAPMILVGVSASVMVSTNSAVSNGDTGSSVASVDTTLTGTDPYADDRNVRGEELVSRARSLAETSYPDLPWTILAAISFRMPTDRLSGELAEMSAIAKDESEAEGSKPDDQFNIDSVVANLSEKDPQRRLRDISAGAMYIDESFEQRKFVIDEKDGGDPEAWGLHTEVEKLYMEALEAGGATESEASAIWDTALAWELGSLNSCSTGISGSQGGSHAGSNAPPGSSAGSFNSDQVENGRAIIGMAKGMFGDDWEKAALIGLITAIQESRLLVYANDGVIGNRPGESTRLDEYPASAYRAVAKSVELPHQAVGSDYVSLGLFQQQLIGSWGTLGESSFKTDPDATMRRLMSPSFSAFAFFRVLDTKEGWRDMDPVRASDLVQVSAHPEAPRKHLATAKAFINDNRDAPEIAPPESGETSQSGGSGGCAQSVDFSAVVGGFAHPLGDDIGWSTYLGQVAHAAGATDWIRPQGTPVFSLAAGTVIGVSYSPTALWCATIEHTPTLGSFYCHTEKPLVKVGDTVKAGQKIGVIATATPYIQVDHLHFEVTKRPRMITDVSAHYKTAKFLADRGINPGPCYRPGDPCYLAE